jgi:hypothetical protein
MKLTVHRGQPHEYFDHESGKHLFSVSQVRQVMWDGLSKVPKDILDAARIRGTLLHLRFAKCLYARAGVTTYPPVIPEYVGYCKSMDDWLDKHKVRPIVVEQKSANLELGYAGTIDAKLLYDAKEIITGTDMKSGQPTPTDTAQLLAYKEMKGMKDAKQWLDLYLNPDGGEAREVWLKPKPSDWAAFMNALASLKASVALEAWRASL